MGRLRAPKRHPWVVQADRGARCHPVAALAEDDVERRHDRWWRLGQHDCAGSLVPARSALDRRVRAAPAERSGDATRRAQQRGDAVVYAAESIGERPAGVVSVDSPIVQIAARTLAALGLEPSFDASSTDANVADCRGDSGGLHRADDRWQRASYRRIYRPGACCEGGRAIGVVDAGLVRVSFRAGPLGPSSLEG